MTDKIMVDIPHEGEIVFNEENEEDTSSDSPTENNTETEEETEETGDGGEGTGTEAPPKEPDDPDNLPFHKHPRWTEREDEWKNKFNEQEQRHQDDIKAIREEFASARQENKENTEIPSWFGGTQEQWNEYRQWNDQQIKQAEDRALKRLDETKSAESEAVKEATDFMRTEIEFLQSDKTLNPEGKKVDPNKLLAVVTENDLIDSKGRWNYRAAWKLIQNQATATPAPVKPKEDRKVLAGATTSDNRGEGKPKNFKTADDFKQVRPW